MLIGIRPLIEAIQAGKDIEKVLVQKGLRGDLFNEARKVMQEHGVVFKTVPPEKLNSITTKNHQGVIAFISPITFGNIENIVPAIYERGETPLLVYLDGVTDVRNFGAIARSAECFGAHAVIIPQNNSAGINEEAIKTSAGALNNIPVCRIQSTSAFTEYMQQCGIALVGSTEKGSVSPDSYNFNQPICVVLGNEETGISHELIRKCDALVKIPMTGKTSSLNVSVATGIVLYETLRQRNV
ncbi:MAG: 23S rRNA (guanosine(2251)-2'-O)-methyltransferase RlmB [Flavobacteriales bacterium]|nr:23S rRNA (guanosine(2251)-2'-O)-methyltransferase RlmB [Flavobacteriales bacterium]